MELQKTPVAPDVWLASRNLYTALPTARELRKLKAADGRTIRIRCDRSMPYEFVGELLNAYLATWGANAVVQHSDYDPALAQLESAGEHDVRILFLDWRLTARMPAPDAAAWLAGRARAALRQNPKAPVLVNNWPDEWAAPLNAELAKLHVPGLFLVDLLAVRKEIAGDFFDPRNDAISKFPFSNAAAIATARHLGLDLLPSLLGERIKGLVLDLDDTLWGGVLGEDGASKVRVGEGHKALHRKLRELRSRGILLTLCSRNELADVEAVFEQRADLGVSLDDFAAVRVNWQPKAANIVALASELNVHPSSLLFVDDNPSELAKAQGAIDGLRVLLADPEGRETAAALRHYPGLFAVTDDAAAALRTGDIQKNREREKLREEAADLMTYLAALKMEVQLAHDERAHAERVYELSNKTNQFNLALKRMSRAQADAAFDGAVMTVHVRDALSDSGLVGVFVARLDGACAVVEEVLFSCRVLGREIEALALAHFARALAARGATRVRFDVTEGPRNQPARDWLARVMPDGPSDSLDALRARLEPLCAKHPAKVEAWKRS